MGITRIELDDHRCQTFLRKMSVQRALYCLIAKPGRFYKSNRYCQNIIKCHQNTSLIFKMFAKIVSISMLFIL